MSSHDAVVGFFVGYGPAESNAKNHITLSRNNQAEVDLDWDMVPPFCRPDDIVTKNAELARRRQVRAGELSEYPTPPLMCRLMRLMRAMVATTLMSRIGTMIKGLCPRSEWRTPIGPWRTYMQAEFRVVQSGNRVAGVVRTKILCLPHRRMPI